MSSCSGQIWNFKNLITAKSGGCGCGSKSSTDTIVPKPISKTSGRPSSAPSAAATSDRSSQILPESHHRPEIASAGRKFDDSLAVVKDSDDPYSDFRQSMLQMIFEKEIYSGKELQHLLHCFLELNSTNHHEVIVRAFMEICNGGGTVADGGEEAIFSKMPT